jgi:hypothetical protein
MLNDEIKRKNQLKREKKKPELTLINPPKS